MTAGFRVLLILGAVIYFVVVVRKIRASTIEPADTLFWLAFSFVLLLISLFPDIITALCRLIGIQSPANMVFLCIIALLSYKCFSMTIKISELTLKQKTLVAALSAQTAAERHEEKKNDAANTDEGENP